jgi:hypothetical protein
MSSFDYSAPAELFLFKPAKGSRTKYRRFATAAEALRYAVEDLRLNACPLPYALLAKYHLTNDAGRTNSLKLIGRPVWRL